MSSHMPSRKTRFTRSHSLNSRTCVSHAFATTARRCMPVVVSTTQRTRNSRQHNGVKKITAVATETPQFPHQKEAANAISLQSHSRVIDRHPPIWEFADGANPATDRFARVSQAPHQRA